MENLTKVTPEQAEMAWRIYHLAFSVSSLIMTSIFGDDPQLHRILKDTSYEKSA